MNKQQWIASLFDVEHEENEIFWASTTVFPVFHCMINTKWSHKLNYSNSTKFKDWANSFQLLVYNESFRFDFRCHLNFFSFSLCNFRITNKIHFTFHTLLHSPLSSHFILFSSERLESFSLHFTTSQFNFSLCIVCKMPFFLFLTSLHRNDEKISSSTFGCSWEARGEGK